MKTDNAAQIPLRVSGAREDFLSATIPPFHENPTGGASVRRDSQGLIELSCPGCRGARVATIASPDGAIDLVGRPRELLAWTPTSLLMQ